MHTVICDLDPGVPKPTLVFVHGYGDCLGMYFQIMKRLSKYFRLHMVDHVGMGLSSRPNNFSSGGMSARQALDYFINYFEAWRTKLGLQEFYLAGHSLGAYLAGHYANAYPKHVKKLMLLSPNGVCPRVEGTGRVKNWQKLLGTTYRPPRALVGIAQYCVRTLQLCPYTFLRFLGPKHAHKSLSEAVKENFKGKSSQLIEAVTMYSYHNNMRSGGTECMFNVLFTLSVDGLTEALLPLADTAIMQGSHPLQVSFIFGENDIALPIDDGESRRITELKGEESKYYIVAGAGHNMHWDHAQELTGMIINDLLGLDVQNDDDLECKCLD